MRGGSEDVRRLSDEYEVSYFDKPEVIEGAKRTMRRHFADPKTGTCQGCAFEGRRDVEFPCGSYLMAQVIVEGPQKPWW